jgi:hypothetical protein
MTVREYLKAFSESTSVTFIKARARKDANTPFYHAEYQTTPIRPIWEWEKSAIMDYYILNNKQCPIDWLSGAPWKIAFDKGNLLSLLVISKEDIETLYSPKQAQEMIAYIEKKIKEGGAV